MRLAKGIYYVVRLIQKEIGWIFQIILFLIIFNLLGKNLYSSINELPRNSSRTPEDELSSAVDVSQREFEEEQARNFDKKNLRRKERELVYSEEAEEDILQDILPPLSNEMMFIAVEPPPTILKEELKASQDKRVRLLHEECSRLNLGLWKNQTAVKNLNSSESEAVSSVPNVPLYQSLLVSEKLHLSFCPVAGAGSNWVSNIMLQLVDSLPDNKASRQDSLNLAVRRFAFLESWNRYSEVLKISSNMLVIRHPFDRLIEAYKRSFVNVDVVTDNIFKLYAPFIIRMYRKNLPNIIHPYYYGSKKPTFDEFCNFLVTQSTLRSLNSWKSITQQCTPCDIPYNFIVEYETMFQEVMWILKRSGKSVHTSDYIHYEITQEVRQRYFSNLKKELILQLYEKYKLDFDLFGYNIEKYMQFAKNGI